MVTIYARTSFYLMHVHEFKRERSIIITSSLIVIFYESLSSQTNKKLWEKPFVRVCEMNVRVREMNRVHIEQNPAGLEQSPRVWETSCFFSSCYKIT